MREVFSRVEEDSEVSIEVDIEASQYKSESPWLFSVFIKYDAHESADTQYEEFLEMKESLIIAVEFEDVAHYIGSRIIDGWSEFYFCASGTKDLSSMAKSILSGTGYVYESNSIKDKKWDFYELQLFPKELELIDIQSEKIIFLLAEEGDDLKQTRDVEHYISFETPTQKQKFLDSLDIVGFSFKDDISADEFENGVALVKNHAVTSEIVKEIVHELYEKVKENNGYYEGWSTTLVDGQNI